MVKELTSDLPPPPAPYLSPTLVVVQDRPSRNVTLAFRLLYGGLAALLFHSFLTDRSPQDTTSVLVGLGLVGGVAYLAVIARPVQMRAGSNWFSSNAGRTWVDLDNLKSCEMISGSEQRLTDTKGTRARIDSLALRECPVLYDLLYRALLKAEREGRLEEGAPLRFTSTNRPGTAARSCERSGPEPVSR